mmetsp:Transcript_13241/g.45806  ORF Transcript_13241/g.45806 Transcript_13241/m.45806 type:complete len:203 (+) Transcript_13241:240-848(+)
MSSKRMMRSPLPPPPTLGSPSPVTTLRWPVSTTSATGTLSVRPSSVLIGMTVPVSAAHTGSFAVKMRSDPDLTKVGAGSFASSSTQMTGPTSVLGLTLPSFSNTNRSPKGHPGGMLMVRLFSTTSFFPAASTTVLVCGTTFSPPKKMSSSVTGTGYVFWVPTAFATSAVMAAKDELMSISAAYGFAVPKNSLKMSRGALSKV